MLQEREVTTLGEMSVQLIEWDSPKALNCTELTLILMGFSSDNSVCVFGAVNDTNGKLIDVGNYVRVDENRVRHIYVHHKTHTHTYSIKHYANVQEGVFVVLLLR